MGGYIILYVDGHRAFVSSRIEHFIYTHMPAAVEPF